MNIYIPTENDIIHETSVDFVLRPCAKEIYIVQYDKSLPIIKVELYRNGERYVLPETGVVVNVRLGKLDKTFVYKSILGTNSERNAVYFEIDEQMATIPGHVGPVIEVIEGSKVACSSPIHMIIERNPIQNDQQESEDYYPIIYELQAHDIDHEARIVALESQVSGEVVTLHTNQYNIDGEKTFNNSVCVSNPGKLSLYYDISDQYHATNKKYVDTAIQEAVEGIEIRSDVIDVLGTYQDLQNYDTTDVRLNDLIKVISDETHNNATSYYRWEEISGTNQWNFVASEGPYYTISQSEERFVNVSDRQEINGYKRFYDPVQVDALWFGYLGDEEGGPAILYDDDLYGWFYNRILSINVGTNKLKFLQPEDYYEGSSAIDYVNPNQIRLLNIADPISDMDVSNKRYTDRKLELHPFDGFVGGTQVHDQIQNGQTMYCQSGTQTDTDPSQDPLIQIKLDQSSASVSNRKALYINKISISYELDNDPGNVRLWEFTIESRLFIHVDGGTDIEPHVVTLTDPNTGVSLDWMLEYTPTSGKTYYGAYSSGRGQQFGSSSNAAELIILKTTSLQNCTVKAINVKVSGGSGTRATVSIQAALDQWDVNASTNITITSSNTEYDFTHGSEGTHLGSGGGEVITYEHVFLKKDNNVVSTIQPNSDYLYIEEDGTNDTYRLYKYVSQTLQEVSKTRLGTTSDTAYRGDYGQDNYNKIRQVREQTFTFTGVKTFANDVYMEWGTTLYIRDIKANDEDGGYSYLAEWNPDGYCWKLHNISWVGESNLVFMQAEDSSSPGYICSPSVADSYRIMNLADPINDRDAVNKRYADTKVVANTAITGATKCKITYDSKGLVTAGADLAASDIPSLDTSKITSGTFADARIASASTWNAKYSKPSGGIPASDLAETYVKANNAITGATKCKITYDSKGLVTAGADLAASDIPSLDASKITSGTFADARIASASTWNAKYSKPSGGIPASDLAETYVKANNAITGATKCKITYDSKGLVTAGADLAASDIPNLDTSKITSGTFADARIASASTWNAKYSKPSGGIPASDLAETYVKANNAITGATKCKITYDSKGLVTAGADLAASDIPSLDASKITSGTFADARIASASTWNAKYTKPSTGIPASDLAETYVKANTAITGATKCKITYDSKGLVTAGADLAASDIPSLDTSKITSGTFADARIASASTWNAKTKVTLNGTAVTSATIYAATSGGTAGQVLQSNGANQAPTWVTLGTGGTVTKITAGTGLTTTSGSTTDGGNITSSGTLYLTKVITGATKCKVTYDDYGRITAGADLAASDIPNLSASKITSDTLDRSRLPDGIGHDITFNFTCSNSNGVMSYRILLYFADGSYEEFNGSVNYTHHDRSYSYSNVIGFEVVSFSASGYDSFGAAGGTAKGMWWNERGGWPEISDIGFMFDIDDHALKTRAGVLVLTGGTINVEIE